MPSRWVCDSDEYDDWGWDRPLNVSHEERGAKLFENSNIDSDRTRITTDSLAGCMASLVLVNSKNDYLGRSKARLQARRVGGTGRVAQNHQKHGDRREALKYTEDLLRAGELQMERSGREAKERAHQARLMESKMSEDARRNERPFPERCASDSAALLNSSECPEHFRGVDQLFPKLEPAKTCANQHNMVGGALPEKEVVFSKCGDVPDRHRRTGLLRFGGWDDARALIDTKDPSLCELRGPCEPHEPEVLFDFSGNAGPEANSNVYREKLEVTEEQERTAEELKRQYLDILGKLDVDLGTTTGGKKAKVDGGPAVKTETKVTERREDKPHYPRDYPQALRIFAIQDFSKYHDEAGKRKTTYRYRVCPLSTAWRELKDCEDQTKMHWYEIIREGFPCHMYFDLEYPKGPGLNEGLDDDALVDTLLHLVRTRLKADFDLDLREDQIYELDSTTNRKFSRHLIVRIPGHAFYNVDHVGYFVQQVCADSGSRLLVRQNTETERMGYVVDTGVYTKNRLFRLAYNCKCGGTGQTLQPTRRFATASPQTPARVFASTLVTHLGGIGIGIRGGEGTDGKGSTDGADGVGVFGGQDVNDQTIKLLAVRRMLTMPQAVRDVQTGVEGIDMSAAVGHPTVGAPGNGFVEEKPLRQEANQFLPPKEAMARLSALAREAVPYIQTYATNRSGRPVAVKSWQILGGYGDVAYSLAGPGAHFCSNKGGDHNSNFVYVVANFYHARVAQKCFDQETCYKYKSPSTQMPERFRWDPAT